MGKLRRSKADANLTGYKEWLLSELPVHGPSYKEYVDDSAWMANLWIGWTLEFFVEMFAKLHGGRVSHIPCAIAHACASHHASWGRVSCGREPPATGGSEGWLAVSPAEERNEK